MVRIGATDLAVEAILVTLGQLSRSLPDHPFGQAIAIGPPLAAGLCVDDLFDDPSGLRTASRMLASGGGADMWSSAQRLPFFVRSRGQLLRTARLGSEAAGFPEKLHPFAELVLIEAALVLLRLERLNPTPWTVGKADMVATLTGELGRLVCRVPRLASLVVEVTGALGPRGRVLGEHVLVGVAPSRAAGEISLSALQVLHEVAVLEASDALKTAPGAIEEHWRAVEQLAVAAWRRLTSSATASHPVLRNLQDFYDAIDDRLGGPGFASSEASKGDVEEVAARLWVTP